MDRYPRFRHLPLHTLTRRLGALWRRLYLRRLVPSSRVELMEVNAARYKRLTFRDAWRATANHRHLERFAASGIFPAPVAAFENELLVEYVPGRTLERFTADDVEALAHFFAVLYATDSAKRPAADTPFPAATARDLRFLADVGVLAGVLADRARTEAEACLPAELWVGYEYIDALPKNFVAADDGRLVGIDVEAIFPDYPIGIGVAKCFLNLPSDLQPALVEKIAAQSGVDLSASLRFLRLHFLARWTKLLYLKGRARLIDPGHIERLLSG